jgi:hypothetical protein
LIVASSIISPLSGSTIAPSFCSVSASSYRLTTQLEVDVVDRVEASGLGGVDHALLGVEEADVLVGVGVAHADVGGVVGDAEDQGRHPV